MKDFVFKKTYMYACVYDILKNYYSIRQGALLNRGASIEAVKEYNLNCFGFFCRISAHFLQFTLFWAGIISQVPLFHDESIPKKIKTVKLFFLVGFVK